MQQATADALKMLNEANPNEQVVKIKALEAFEAAADGKATKIIIPSELQGLARPGGLGENRVGQPGAGKLTMQKDAKMQVPQKGYLHFSQNSFPNRPQNGFLRSGILLSFLLQLL